MTRDQITLWLRRNRIPPGTTLIPVQEAINLFQELQRTRETFAAVHKALGPFSLVAQHDLVEAASRCLMKYNEQRERADLFEASARRLVEAIKDVGPATAGTGEKGAAIIKAKTELEHLVNPIGTGRN